MGGVSVTRMPMSGASACTRSSIRDDTEGTQHMYVTDTSPDQAMKKIKEVNNDNSCT